MPRSNENLGQADIGRFVQEFRDPEGQIGYAPLEEVWSLAGQRTADANG